MNGYFILAIVCVGPMIPLGKQAQTVFRRIADTMAAHGMEPDARFRWKDVQKVDAGLCRRYAACLAAFAVCGVLTAVLTVLAATRM